MKEKLKYLRWLLNHAFIKLSTYYSMCCHTRKEMYEFSEKDKLIMQLLTMPFGEAVEKLQKERELFEKK